ncbi:MAG TPA: ABC transporter ATP-binding protein [Solirubrobacteraceae bacterium]
MLAVEDLHVRYGKVAAVRGVSLSCEPGELVALLGPNGAGKSSTLLGIAGGLERGSVTGAIALDGRSLQGLAPEDVSRAGVVLVPERRRIFASLTVRENLIVGASAWAGRGAAIAHAAEVLAQFPMLASMAERQGGLLSGGQQQLLAIARALMAKPRVLLLDEPSIGLAREMVRTVFETISRLRDEGLAIVLVEQNVGHAIELADRALLLRKGRIEGEAQTGAEHVLGSYLGQRS